jgi:hypothetical protein
MAEPMIARINAYSAAEAPDLSFSSFRNLVIALSFRLFVPSRRRESRNRDDDEESDDAKSGAARTLAYFGNIRFEPPRPPG